MTRLLRCALITGVLLGLSWGCNDENDPDPSDDTEWSKPVLIIEVDWQNGMKPFAEGESYVRSLFGDSVSIQFEIDSTKLTPRIIPLAQAHTYYLTHRMSSSADPNKALYPYYLCGISLFSTNDSIPLDTIFGMSSPDVERAPSPHRAWSYICMAAQDMDASMSTKCCAHELGHQLLAPNIFAEIYLGAATHGTATTMIWRTA